MYTLLLLLLDPLVWRNRREDPNNPPPPPREYGFERNNGMRERGGFETRGDDRASIVNAPI